MNAAPPAGSWSWTPCNLVGLLLVGAGLSALVAWRAWRNPALVAEDLTVYPAALAPAVDKIDPNSASAASLARLPGIGPGRAEDICEYRGRFAPNRPAFTRLDDLRNVKGIGPATLKRIAPYVTFPEAAPPPASQPAASQPAASRVDGS